MNLLVEADRIPDQVRKLARGYDEFGLLLVESELAAILARFHFRDAQRLEKAVPAESREHRESAEFHQRLSRNLVTLAFQGNMAPGL